MNSINKSFIIAFFVIVSAVAFAESTYTVKSGDNDWAIAKQFGISVEKLHELNPDVNFENLQIGTVLKLSSSKKQTKSTAPKSTKTKAKVTRTDVNLRSGPGTSYEKRDMVTKGDQGSVLEIRDGWTKIMFSSKKIGWVRNDMVAILSATPKKETTKPAPKKETNKSDLPDTVSSEVKEGSKAKTETKPAPAKKEETKKAPVKKEEAKKEQNEIVITNLPKPPVKQAQDSDEEKTEETAEKEAPGKPAIVTATNVNVRSGIGTSTQKVSSVTRGDKVTILLYKDGWCKLELPGGGIGWVKRDFLHIGTELPKEPVVAVGKSISAILDTAHKQQGVPYVWGGTSRSGFDCSGFVYYTFGKHGVKLPRTSAAMATVGQTVSRSNLKPGDLVFFRTTRGPRISHVGIFIGNGKFIHASSGGGKVRINELSQTYYNKRYAGAKRIVKDSGEPVEVVSEELLEDVPFDPLTAPEEEPTSVD